MQANETTHAQDAVGTSHADGACPIGRAGSLVGDRWSLLILREATLGVRRFDDFRVRLGIADNILAARLRRLVEHDLLAKVPYHDGRRARSEYRLTAAGADFAPVLLALGRWGEQHARSSEQHEPMRVVHLECGGEVGVDQRCAECGEVIGRDQQGWIRPWHSADPALLAEPLAAAEGTTRASDREE